MDISVDDLFRQALAAGRPAVPPRDPAPARCCSRPRLVRESGHLPGVCCSNCGRVDSLGYFELGIERDGNRDIVPRTYTKKSMYKPEYYFMERLAQLQARDTPVPQRVLERVCLAILGVLFVRSSRRVDKAVVQSALGSLSDHTLRRKYLERYPQIIHAISKRPLPVLSPRTTRSIRRSFSSIVGAWRGTVRPAGRKHIPHYSYLILRLLERAGYPQYAFWLPPLKTRSKVLRTGLWWRQICHAVGWFPTRWMDPEALQDRLQCLAASNNPHVVRSLPRFTVFVEDARRATEFNGRDGVSARGSLPVNDPEAYARHTQAHSRQALRERTDYMDGTLGPGSPSFLPGGCEVQDEHDDSPEDPW